jgi:hypothetical protein
VIDAVTAADQAGGECLDDGLEFDYEKPSEKPDCRWRVKAERERMLTRVAGTARLSSAAARTSHAARFGSWSTNTSDGRRGGRAQPSRRELAMKSQKFGLT